MRFLPLLVANLLRKKVRTLLTIGSFAVAMFLFGLLATLRAAFSQVVDAAGADRLVITNKVSIIQPLPIAYRERILKQPGVAALTSFSWFGGVYQDEKNFFPQFSIDPENQLVVYNEFKVPPEQWQALLADRAGCVAGATIAKRFSWKLGDRIPIRGTIFQGAWEFNLRGIYTGTSAKDDLTQFWFRRDYLEEKAEPWAKGIVGWYALKIAPGNDAVAIQKAIDEGFANSAFETRTQTEQALATSFAKQMGNIELILLSVGAVVFFTLLLVTGNTMAIAVRERTTELAVLKALGYGDGFVLGLVLFESTLIAAFGAGLGLAGAKAFTLGGDPTGGMLPVFYLSDSALATGIGFGLSVGLIAGALPALQAMRLRVVDALRRV
jgi:putative ABC transport system permease protein